MVVDILFYLLIIFKDIIKMYGQNAVVVLKPHPRDVLDYNVLFSEYLRIDRTVPMEMLNFIPNAHFDQLISVLTETEAIQFAAEKIKLGPDFMDIYEEAHIHRQNEQI